MGKLDDARKQAEAAMQQAMQGAGAPVAGAGAMNVAAAQAETNALKAEAAALPDDSPLFEPIAGVTYQQYVDLCVKLQPAGADAAKQEELALANGLTPEQWKAASEGYTQRCQQDQTFARRLGMDVMNHPDA